MIIPHSSSVKRILFSILFMSVGFPALIIFLSSCSTGMMVNHTDQQIEDVSRTQYSIVCIIHGDGDYLYHDTSSNEHKADQEALAQVISISRQNPQAEVLIFHQQPKRNFLFFFPQKDGEFYYYRNGRLIANEMYWRNQQHSDFDPEIALYNRFHTNDQNKMVRVFMYFGHEIPEFGGAGYNLSYPGQEFNINDLAEKLKGFTHDSSRFDLMILSTCFGGTPYTIETLGSYARIIVASPDNLHLSYFNLSSLERLDISLRNRDVLSFAKRFAQQAFDRLTSDVQTAVSVAVYDVDSTQEYLHSVQGIYNQTLSALKSESPVSKPIIEPCDCAEIPGYVLPIMNKGVDIFYRPARFGRLKSKYSHSGWECWMDIKKQGTILKLTEPVQKSNQ